VSQCAVSDGQDETHTSKLKRDKRTTIGERRGRKGQDRKKRESLNPTDLPFGGESYGASAGERKLFYQTPKKRRRKGRGKAGDVLGEKSRAPSARRTYVDKKKRSNGQVEVFSESKSGPRGGGSNKKQQKGGKGRE